MLQHAGRRGTVCKELTAVLLRSDRKPDGVLGHSDGRVSNQPVKAEAGDMQHVRRHEHDQIALSRMRLIRGSLVLVVQLAVGVPIHAHLVRHERVEPDDLAFAVPYDLRVGVPVKQ